MEKTVFLEKTELERLEVQGRLLQEYEQPVYRQVIDGRTNLTLLDVGCNDGKKTKGRFSEENFSKVIGVDCLEPLIKQAEENYGDQVFSFRHCDLSIAGFEERIREIMEEKEIASFDVIHCSFLLMHLEEPVKLLTELRKFLSPEGRLIVIEPDDTENYLSPDVETLFETFLKILSMDPYSGKRVLGGELPEILKKSGYSEIELKCSEICASGKEHSKKEDIFITFCSYLPEDLELLHKENPEEQIFEENLVWVGENFEKLYLQTLSEETTVSIGVKIYVCR